MQLDMFGPVEVVILLTYEERSSIFQNDFVVVVVLVIFEVAGYVPPLSCYYNTTVPRLESKTIQLGYQRNRYLGFARRSMNRKPDVIGKGSFQGSFISLEGTL